MDYAEHAVPDDLQRLVECVWTLRDDAPQAGVQTVFPDGRCELILHLATPMRWHPLDARARRQTPLLFAAQQRGPIRLQAEGALHCVGVRLRPAASALLVGPALAAMRDDIHDLRRVAAEQADGFAQSAQAFVQAEPHPLWSWLRQRAAGFQIDAGIEAVVQVIDAEPQARIAGLPARAGRGLRSFQIAFLDAVGLTAKEYARIRRLQAALRMLDRGETSIAAVAAERGYADQAHATREFARLTGVTPARLWQALRRDRDDATALRLAAAFVRGRSDA
jgi:AraC-like DNA-binding protein